MGLLRDNGEKEYELYSDPTQGVYRALGMLVTLTEPARRPEYISTGYWSKVGEGTSIPFVPCLASLLSISHIFTLSGQNPLTCLTLI